jgi:hypothetical protein
MNSEGVNIISIYVCKRIHDGCRVHKKGVSTFMFYIRVAG